ncbi:hypothetical protein BDA96_03G113600 [Sorghum bicolor]|uniref:Small ribosomal subunit protein uS7 domain-containing protein n=2 Tax=Sorghum bicolor TaxID=4558 RepID=A0A1W0VWU1_SORBI|nr:hypothetical protein BDA96_03G113600 [Sorghum bicolor]OQU86590.1 hypothetical protein SORBI_3003G109250 [Sorghum bicolor]
MTRRWSVSRAAKVAIEIRPKQGRALAIRWLLEASQKHSGQNMAFKLSSELLDAAKGSGDTICNKEASHRMAETNRGIKLLHNSLIHEQNLGM